MPQASCPHCQALVAFTEDERGNIIPCSRCEQRFRLPAAKATPPVQRSRKDDDEEDDNRRGKERKSGPPWLFIGLLGGGLVLLLCCGLGVWGVSYMVKTVQEEMEEDAAEVQKAKAQAVPVTAGALVEQFRDDQAAANLKYLGNYVRVQGTVDEIGADEDGLPIVYLQGTQALKATRVECHFDGDDDNMTRRARQLLKGRTVTILGQCNGQAGNIKLNECELVD